MYVLPTSCIRLDSADNLAPENVHLISQFAPRTQFLAVAVVTVPRYIYDLELTAFLQTICDETCTQVVVLRGLMTTPFALRGDDTPADVDKIRPNLVSLIVLQRSHATTEPDSVTNKGQVLYERIPGSTLQPYVRLIRVKEFESDAVLVCDVIAYPKKRSEKTEITVEAIWVAIDALAMRRGLQLGPWGMECTLWFVWRELIARNVPCPTLVWRNEDEIPRCQQARLLMKQAFCETDPVLRQSYVNSIDPAVRNVIEGVLDRGAETNEAKAHWELKLEAQKFGLENGDLIVADIIKSELAEYEESAKL